MSQNGDEVVKDPESSEPQKVKISEEQDFADFSVLAERQRQESGGSDSSESQNGEKLKEEEGDQANSKSFTMRELIHGLDEETGADNEPEKTNGVEESRTREGEIQSVADGFMGENEQENGGLFRGVTVYEGERPGNNSSAYPTETLNRHSLSQKNMAADLLSNITAGDEEGRSRQRILSFAAKRYASAIERNPQDYDALYNWALVLQESADNVGPDSSSPSKDALLEEACRKYDEATRLCPTLHDAFYNWAIAISDRAKMRGRTKEAEELWKQATKNYEKAVQLNWNSPQVTKLLVRVLCLGNGLSIMDRDKEAIEHYYGGNQRKYETIWRIIDKRWTRFMVGGLWFQNTYSKEDGYPHLEVSLVALLGVSAIGLYLRLYIPRSAIGIPRSASMTLCLYNIIFGFTQDKWRLVNHIEEIELDELDPLWDWTAKSPLDTEFTTEDIEALEEEAKHLRRLEEICHDDPVPKELPIRSPVQSQGQPSSARGRENKKQIENCLKFCNVVFL